MCSINFIQLTVTQSVSVKDNVHLSLQMTEVKHTLGGGWGEEERKKLIYFALLYLLSHLAPFIIQFNTHTNMYI